MTKEKGVKKSEIPKMISEAYELVQEALSLDDKNYAVHKWVAIVVDAKSTLEGIKQRISTLPLFKKHLTVIDRLKFSVSGRNEIHFSNKYIFLGSDETQSSRRNIHIHARSILL